MQIRQYLHLSNKKSEGNAGKYLKTVLDWKNLLILVWFCWVWVAQTEFASQCFFFFWCLWPPPAFAASCEALSPDLRGAVVPSPPLCAAPVCAAPTLASALVSPPAAGPCMVSQSHAQPQSALPCWDSITDCTEIREQRCDCCLTCSTVCGWAATPGEGSGSSGSRLRNHSVSWAEGSLRWSLPWTVGIAAGGQQRSLRDVTCLTHIATWCF